MASSYTGLGTELMTTGENAGDWGSKTNTNLQIIEQIAGGYTAQSIAGGVQTTTLSVSDGSTGAVLAHRVIEFTGTITGNQTVTIPLDVQTFYVMKNNTSGAYTVNFKYASGSGSSVTWAATDKGTKLIYATADDGTNPNLVDSNIGGVGAYDLDGNELTLDADSDTSITASTDDQIDFEIAGADDFTMTANAFNVLTGSHATFADSANAKFGTGNDMLVYHDGCNSYITNATGALKIATETSGIAITIGHSTSEVTVADNLTVTGTLTGTLATAAQGSVTSLGTLTALTVDDVAVNGKVVTMTGSASDTAVLTAGTNGTLSIVTTDAAAAAANIQITADGTVDIDSAGVLTLDSGAAINIEPASGSAILLDGTISVDAGVVTGATSITSTAFVGDITGDVTGNTSGTAATVTTAAQSNITSLGTLTTLTVDNVNINGATIGHTSDTDLLTLASASLTALGTITVGVDDTGHDVKFFGASAGAYLEWDESADQLRIMGASADATTSTGKLLLATSLTDINASDVIGKIDFQAPHEAGGTDAITVAASIQAMAQGTFSASVNATDLLFFTGHSEAATEKFRFTSQGEIGVGGANYGTDGQVLTSTGAGTAPAWEAASAGSVTAINNATQSELVTIGSTTTELDAEANLTFTGSALTCIGTITTGVDNTGHDVKFFGATSGSFFLWDESDDALELTDSSPIKIGDGGDMTIYHDGTDSFVTNATGALKLATETSGIVVTIGHTTSETTVADNLTITGTTVGTTFDTNGTADAIILDANGNTTISSPTDDQIDFEIAGADDFTMTANTFTILSGSTIAIAAGGAITNAGTMAPDITSTGKAAVFGF